MMRTGLGYNVSSERPPTPISPKHQAPTTESQGVKQPTFSKPLQPVLRRNTPPESPSPSTSILAADAEVADILSSTPIADESIAVSHFLEGTTNPLEVSNITFSQLMGDSTLDLTLTGQEAAEVTKTNKQQGSDVDRIKTEIMKAYELPK